MRAAAAKVTSVIGPLSLPWLRVGFEFSVSRKNACPHQVCFPNVVDSQCKIEGFEACSKI